MFEQFSTRSAAPASRLNYWNEVIGGIFPGMVIDSQPQIDACWSQCSLGDIRFAVADSPRAKIARWQSTPSPCAESGRVLVHLQNVGHSVTSQQRRDAALNAGDMTLCLPDVPYQILISDRNQMIVLDLPEQRLADLCPDWRQAVAGVVPTSPVGTALLRQFLGSIRRNCWTQAPDEEEREALNGIVWQLLQLSLKTWRSQPRPEREGQDLTTRITAFVEQRLADPDLSTSTIARALSLSPRTVQNVFAALATTPTEFILTRRLNRAAEILAGGCDFGSITELAFDMGFNDSAYFARRFRSKFGMTPSAFRASHRN